MRIPTLVLVLGAVPVSATAQQPAPSDSLRQSSDTGGRPPISLQEITVTAAPSKREAPASFVTITPAEIQRTTATSPYDLLRQTAGIEVHEQGQGPGFASDASVRGFSSDHSTDLALWIDGVPINEPVNGHAEGYNDWSLLMPQAVSSIDVIKGPTSALYGNFALAGVVNVRTLERMQGSIVTASGGSFEHFEGSVLTGLDRGRTGAVFGLRALRDGGWRPNSRSTLGQGHARVVRDLSSNASIDFGAELYAAGWDSPGFILVPQFDQERFDSVANRTDGGFKHRAQERVSLRVLASSALTWRSTVYATQGRWQLFLTTPPEGGITEGTGSQLEEEDHRYGFGLTSALTWTVPKGLITLGGEGRFDHTHYENYFVTNRVRDSSQVLVRARQLSGGLFLESATDVARRLQITIGGRYERHGSRSTPANPASPTDTTVSDGKGIFAPKFGALYRLPGIGSLYANASRGFRRTDGVIEDPTLPFITAWAYEGGLKVDHNDLSASAAVFRMDVSNEQTFDPITLASSSGGSSRRQGVELGLQARIGPAFTARAEWTFNDAKYRRLITDDGDTLSGARVFNTAKHLGTVAFDLTPPFAIWQIGASANVVGPYTPFNEVGVVLPTYTLVHFHAGVRVGGTQVQIGVRNLLDHVYPEVRAGGFVSPGQPRSAYGTVRYVF